MATRWASFDCYGTLIDWNAGIRAELARIFTEADADRLRSRYHELEPRIQEDHSALPYREVMARVLAELAGEEGTELPKASPPAAELEIPAIWINRLGEESDLPRAAELPDLPGLADALDRVG